MQYILLIWRYNITLYYFMYPWKKKNKLPKYKLKNIKIHTKPRCAISRLFIKSQSKQLHFIPTAIANAQSARRKCGHWQNNTKTWWQSNTRRARALAQFSSLLTTRCHLFRYAIIVYSVSNFLRNRLYTTVTDIYVVDDTNEATLHS